MRLLSSPVLWASVVCSLPIPYLILDWLLTGSARPVGPCFCVEVLLLAASVGYILYLRANGKIVIVQPLVLGSLFGLAFGSVLAITIMYLAIEGLKAMFSGID